MLHLDVNLKVFRVNHYVFTFQFVYSVNINFMVKVATPNQTKFGPE